MKKAFKKFTGIVLAGAMAAAVVCSAASASAVGEPAQWDGTQTINFEAPQEWLTEENPQMYVHLWTQGVSSYAQWQTSQELMTDTKANNIYTYTVPAGDWNMVIFSCKNVAQTYDSTFGMACAGCTAVTTPDPYEEPNDSHLWNRMVSWKGTNKYGTHRMTVMNQRIIGEYLLKGEEFPTGSGITANADGFYKTVLGTEDVIGDISGDGNVDVQDTILAEKYVSKLITFDNSQLHSGDVTGDGTVTIGDIVKIQKYIAKIIPAL